MTKRNMSILMVLMAKQNSFKEPWWSLKENLSVQQPLCHCATAVKARVYNNNYSVADLGGAHRPHVRPPAQSYAHFVGLFKSFKTSPSLSKSVQGFKSYRLLKFSTQKAPEMSTLALIF